MSKTGVNKSHGISLTSKVERNKTGIIRRFIATQMKKILLVLIACVISLSLLAAIVIAKPDNVDGINVPSGRIPQEIKDNKYPRTYYPNTEKLAKDEMRITALGTGMPNQSPSNVAASFLVELGNGESFLFDLGTGATDRLAGLEADYSKLDKIFSSHLHTDHVGDVAALWVGGWLGGRYTPLHVYGPSGASPELGTKVHIDHIREAWAWDVTSRAGTLPNAGGEIVAHEFDFSKTAVIYDQNGVKVTSFPAIRILDGSVSFRLDWNGRSFVFGGDSYPNKWFIKHAKGAELVVHECMFTPKQLGKLLGTPPAQAVFITSYIHTPPQAFGKIMSEVKPRHAIGYHFWTWHDIYDEIYEIVRETYDGPLTLASDMMMWNVTDGQVVVREAFADENVAPTGTTAAYRSSEREPPSVAEKWISPDINKGK